MRFTRSTCRESGSITIFAAIVLAAVILLNIVLYDFAVLKCNLSCIQPQMKLACNSVLSNYDALLAEKYGLYGYNLSSSHLSGRNFDFFYPSVDNTVEFLEDFAKPKVIKEQIVGLMNLKTPANITETILEAVGVFEDADETCDTHSVCGEAAELLVKMQEKNKQIKQKVEGYFDGYVACVNGYDNKTCIEILNLATQKNTDIKTILGQIISIQEQYYNYNNETAMLFSEQYDLYENLIGKLDEVKQNTNAEKTALEILQKAQLLLNNNAKSQIGSNVKVFSERLNILNQFKNTNQFALEDIKKLLNSNKINSEIKINDIAGSAIENEKDERGNLCQKISNASKETIFTDSKYEISPREYADLPSVKANKEIEKSSFLYDINDEAFMDSFSSFTNLFSYWENLSFDTVATDVTNKLLIDDYIISYMTGRLDGPSNEKLNNEIEYILGGEASSNTNNDTVEQKILMIRFTLNFAKIIKDTQRCAIAESMAMALASIISMGAGVTLYKYIIISSWALIDSYTDVNNLLKGEAVPIIDIEKFDGKVNELQDYSFYLRLLLLFMDEETKLLRISDVIQMNMKEMTGEEYKLSGIYNKIRVKAVVEMQFVFPTVLGLDSTYRREDEYELSY